MKKALETVLVTGASRGIGAAAALRLASPGRRLVLVARSASALEARCREVEAAGGVACPLVADFGDPVSSRACIEHIEREFGVPEGLVLNAAMSNDRAFRETTQDLIERELRVNYLAPAELLLHFLPKMADRGHGRTVVVGSLTSMVPFPGNASYSASKAALATLVRGLRLEYRNLGVDLSVVLPGYTATQMTEKLRSPLRPMSADAVGRAVAQSYARSGADVVPGRMNRVAALMFSAFPTTADRFLGAFSRILVPRAS